LTWQEVQAAVACAPVSRKPVELWSNADVAAVVQLVVLWHVLQFAKPNCAPANGCGGLLVCCQVVKWQPEFPQSVAATTKL